MTDQTNHEVGAYDEVRESLKDQGRQCARECVDRLRAIGLTEPEIINMLHGMAEFLADELEKQCRLKARVAALAG